MFPFHYSLCFPRTHYVFSFTFLDSAVSPQPYLIVLRLLYSDLVLVSRSLVYILRVLVTVDLRTNITCLPSYLSEVPSERSETPARLRPSLVSSVLDLILPGTRSGVDSR